MEGLADLLAAEGIAMTGVILRNARDVSDDGTLITGEMVNLSGQTEAYLALYDPGSGAAGVIAPAGFAVSVNGIAELSQSARGLGEARLQHLTQVARHYTLNSPTDLSTEGPGDARGIQFGAFGYGVGLWSQDSPTGRVRTKQGTIGVIGQTKTGLRFGFGLQTARLGKTNGYLGSSVETDGIGGAVFLTYQPEETGLRLLATATILALDAEIGRNYRNGAAVETARGSTRGEYMGFELEVGYAFQVNERYSLLPYMSYQSSKAKFDGYGETGGTFSGRVSDHSNRSRTLRVGVESAYQMSNSLELIGSVSVGRVSEELTAPSLAVTNLNGMQFSGASSRRDYTIADLSIGVNYQLTPTTQLYGNVELQRSLGSEENNYDAVSAGLGFAIKF
ncbi:autotransporter outer membrane beta-barrel domain-containing protein [Cognatishimia sp. MH4019]|uniref:autotransporter outer membrane beta-barrel domain-containing protein n=1 Tax=Cognatishimia sp. MH4019 TaxID=2854030 RepID=UPI001CD39BA2|nr:autotransporter outer membrane beta-barrel domain-containing protein [Cognatishimia sp. MH4019]